MLRLNNQTKQLYNIRYVFINATEKQNLSSFKRILCISKKSVLSTLLFYVALFYTVYYHRSLGLFALTLAIIGTGLSDVILWSRSVPIILITAIGLRLFLTTNRVHGDLAPQ